MHYFVKSKHLFIGDSKETIEGILEIKDGKIAAILPYHEEVDGEIIDTGDQMVTPGFIDAHVHLYLSSLIHLGKMKAVGATSIEEVVAQAKEILFIMAGKLELVGMRVILDNKFYQRKKI